VPVTVPAGLSNAVAIAAGYGDSLALRSNGTVVAWGYNSSGQTNVPAGLSNVVAIAAGAEHCLALRTNGTVVGWGYNYFGQTNVPSGLNNIMAIAAGGDHNLALRSNGTVVAWGYNNSGQTNVPAGLTNVAAIAGGDFHSLALQSNGTVVAWGGNYNGQTNVPSGLSNVVAIAAGANHSLALRPDGTVAAWGMYYNGMAFVPMTVPAGLSNVMAIAGGGGYSLALLTNGTVVAWGMYFNGSQYVPASAPAGLSNVVAIAAGYFHSLAITTGKGPVIVSAPPPSVSLTSTESTNLSITVSAVSPFDCQWFSNSVPILGETGTTLSITNFDLTKAAVYSVAVWDQYATNTAASVLRLADSPVVLVDGADVGGGTVIRIDTPVTNTMSSAFGTNAELYYTLDGSDPWFDSIPYSGAFTLTSNATIRAIAFDLLYVNSAEAAPIYVQIWPKYPLSTSTAGGGSISFSPPPYTNGNYYISNAAVTLTATPSSGWSFMEWTGDSTDTTNATTVRMDQPRSVQAVFGTSLSLHTNGQGQILLDPATGPYAYGSPVQLTAQPDKGSYFFGWVGAASGFSNPLSILATNASGITALFATLHNDQVSLTVLPSGNGTVAINPFKNVYVNGDTVTLTASPARGNVFTGWSGDGTSGTTNPLTLLLDSSKSITANFALGSATNPPAITQGPGNRTLGAGESTTLSFRFTGDAYSYQWQFDGSSIAGATDSTLTLTNFSASQVGLYSVVVTGFASTATSPAASVALFSVETAEAGALTFPLLILNGPVGASYHLQYSTDLINWSPLAPVLLEESEFYYVDDPLTSHARRFYRAVPQ
jgi:trimeric autotransporter adhesin